MNNYIVKTAGKVYEVKRPVNDLEEVYRMECSFFSPSTPLTIEDPNTGEAATFTKELDENGSIRKVNRL